MSKVLSKLEINYHIEVETNNYKETDKAIQLRKEYQHANKYIRSECIECCSLSTIECQYH